MTSLPLMLLGTLVVLAMVALLLSVELGRVVGGARPTDGAGGDVTVGVASSVSVTPLGLLLARLSVVRRWVVGSAVMQDQVQYEQ